MTNTYINSYRKSQREPKRTGSDTVEDWQLLEASSHSSIPLDSAETQALAKLPNQTIQEAFDALPEDYRLVVYLADIEDFSYKKIADIAGIPIGTVMSRLHRGRKILRTQLADYAVEQGIKVKENVVK